ncbi:MAG: PhnD/SsuA/transferrin family substrate-binding protein [Flavobacterium sp.]|uniref:phosphate/phosphite/phosphonate ABC transporter substrate-binding protein n=1 Tax=Flavobacterium sp. TaxID=239 RepID=UPI002612CAD9|nr:PhnD/SsuA/transferrin family substrate-binding protein [Flavobacterium sp.]MDD5148991.1 PhnD/SsuA/transferrin family substrate-binding protein [Flavobacterium sp.]
MKPKNYRILNKSFWKTTFIDNIFGHKQKIVTFKSSTTLKSHSINTLFIGLCFTIILLLPISGCKQKTEVKQPKYGIAPSSQTTPVYHFAIHALHNPAKLIQVYRPLIVYLNSRLKGVQFSVETSRDYANFEEKYKNRDPEFILPNPWQTLQAMKYGYNVIAQAGDPKDFKGIFLVRKDSGISKPSDLKGKAISYPSCTALAACVMPQYFLFTNGIDINKDIENRYVGSQESSIMNVYLNSTASGVTWPPPWKIFQKEHPKEASQLMVIWETESMINNSVMVRNDIPEDIKNQVQKYLIELYETAEGKTILSNMETARFTKATNEDYNKVQPYIDRFEKEVRKIDRK